MSTPTIILFDGPCTLCAGVVRFIAKRDSLAFFRFASLQSSAAQLACQQLGIELPSQLAAPTPDSIVVLHDGRALTHTDAVLAIVSRLPFPWRVCSVLRIVPRGLRDALYRSIARNRYRWFGKSDRCLVPSPELMSRFLSDDGPRSS